MRELLRLIGFAFITAAFMWMFHIMQTRLALENFTNGVKAGIVYCEKSEAILPDEDVTT